jgi:hypothetical protein
MYIAALAEPARWLMRYGFGFMCVLALGVMGCSETSGADLCKGVTCEDDGNECIEDVCNPANGKCGVPVENGSPCSGGACLDGSCTALVSATGLVDYGGAPPGEGSQITVSVDGTSLITTTDLSGTFSFDVFPGEWFFVTSKEDTIWGEIRFMSVPDTGLSNVQLMVGFDEEIPAFEEECGIALDEAKGFVSLYFVPVSGVGGETATLSVPYGGALTSDPDGNCVVSEMILPDAANPFDSMELEFFNVDLTENLVVTPIAPEGYECALEHPGTVIPVRASFLTGLVDVLCMPVP